jgi:hypothetical protein
VSDNKKKKKRDLQDSWNEEWEEFEKELYRLGLIKEK